MSIIFIFLDKTINPQHLFCFFYMTHRFCSNHNKKKVYWFSPIPSSLINLKENVVVRHLAVCHLEACHLAVCNLADCDLATCHLATCHLSACHLSAYHLADFHSTDCHLGWYIFLFSNWIFGLMLGNKTWIKNGIFLLKKW